MTMVTLGPAILLWLLKPRKIRYNKVNKSSIAWPLQKDDQRGASYAVNLGFRIWNWLRPCCGVLGRGTVCGGAVAWELGRGPASGE